MTDSTEPIRRRRVEEINAEPTARERLERKYGEVWNTAQLADEFDVLGFAAPFVVVRRRSDGLLGSMEFQHQPRFYFNFWTDHRPPSLARGH
jgi:hypothetical protein